MLEKLVDIPAPVLGGMFAFGGAIISCIGGWIGVVAGSRMSAGAARSTKLLELRLAAYGALLGHIADARAALDRSMELIEKELIAEAGDAFEAYQRHARALLRQFQADAVIISDHLMDKAGRLEVVSNFSGLAPEEACKRAYASLRAIHQVTVKAARN